MLNVFITIDTEIWDIDARQWAASEVDDKIAAWIYGKTETGQYGILYKIKLLNKYGFKATFFVESLCIDRLGVEKVKPIIDLIQDEGHEVQLHVHPEWDERHAKLPDNQVEVKYLHQLSVGEQAELIKRGLENLTKCGVESICAFRAGNYGSNHDTLKALSRNGILIDSSYNPCFLDTACKFGTMGQLKQPVEMDSIIEIPISYFNSISGSSRSAQVCACSFQEMSNALDNAWQQGWYSFVIVSHSFELVNISNGSSKVRVNRINTRRFERLLKLLSENRDKFNVTTFSKLVPDDIPLGNNFKPLRVNSSGTIVRYVEQLLKALGS